MESYIAATIILYMVPWIGIRLGTREARQKQALNSSVTVCSYIRHNELMDGTFRSRQNKTRLRQTKAVSTVQLHSSDSRSISRAKKSATSRKSQVR